MRKNKSIIWTLVLLLAMNVTAYAAYAQSPKTADPIAMSEINTYRLAPPAANNPALQQTAAKGTSSTSYVDTPIEKMGVGVINATTSWADIPAKIAEVSQRDNIFLGVTLGLGEGLVSGVARGTAGVVDMAAFGVAPYDQPLMKPQYKVENPNEGFKVDILKW